MTLSPVRLIPACFLPIPPARERVNVRQGALTVRRRRRHRHLQCRPSFALLSVRQTASRSVLSYERERWFRCRKLESGSRGSGVGTRKVLTQMLKALAGSSTNFRRIRRRSVSRFPLRSRMEDWLPFLRVPASQSSGGHRIETR